MYVTDLITGLWKSGRGCYLESMFIESLMCADQLMLSGSLCDLQSMVEIHSEETDGLDINLM